MTPDEIAELCKGKDTYYSVTVQHATYTVTLFYTDVELYRNKERIRFICPDSRSQSREIYNAIKDTLHMVT